MISFDTARIAPRDRQELIRETIWDKVVRVDIQHQDDPNRIRAAGEIKEVGALTICSVRSNATTITRTPRLSHDHLEPSVFLGLQLTGSSMVLQRGREAVLRPGDLALYDTTEPYTLLNDDGIHQHYFRIPRTRLALPADDLRRVTAVRFDRDTTVADIVGQYFTRLATNRTPLSAVEADALAEPSIHLLRALITTQLAGAGPAGNAHTDTLRESLPVRVTEYVRRHLGERDLTPARIAAHHHVSVRQLYLELSRAGIGLGDFIRSERLQRCRRDLADPTARYRTIAAISRHWGFVDATHFSRAFRDAYGVTPREWRRSAGTVTASGSLSAPGAGAPG